MFKSSKCEAIFKLPNLHTVPCISFQARWKPMFLNTSRKHQIGTNDNPKAGSNFKLSNLWALKYSTFQTLNVQMFKVWSEFQTFKLPHCPLYTFSSFDCSNFQTLRGSYFDALVRPPHRKNTKKTLKNNAWRVANLTGKALKLKPPSLNTISFYFA